VALLEEVGLLRLRETRRKRGTTEKYYEAIASLLSVDSGLFRSRDGGRIPDPKLGIGLDLLEEAKAELAAFPPASKSDLLPAVMRLRVRARTARLAALREELVTWLREWAEAAEEDGGAATGLTLTLALIPSLADASLSGLPPKPGRRAPGTHGTSPGQPSTGRRRRSRA
jgi:hypothetical protein